MVSLLPPAEYETLIVTALTPSRKLVMESEKTVTAVMSDDNDYGIGDDNGDDDNIDIGQ